MISKAQIEELRDQWQTPELNIAREYVQHLLLSSLYGQESNKLQLAFKGGTALRLLRRSPRFSEDLDFTGWGKPFHADESIKKTLKEASKTGLDFKILDSHPTSGGWFALVETRLYDWPVQVEWNISLRKQKTLKTETVLVTSPMAAPYSVKALSLEEMVQEKIEALLRRKEPRDFFDIYYLIRERLGNQKIAANKTALITHTKALNQKSLEKELKQFLPRGHWTLTKQLQKLLIQELERF